LLEEVDQLAGRKGDEVVELRERWRDGDAVEGAAGEGEEGVGGEAGAGAVGAPLVPEETGVGVDVAVWGRVARAGCGGAVFDVGAVLFWGQRPWRTKAACWAHSRALGCPWQNSGDQERLRR
jgi:hypothetical protein